MSNLINEIEVANLLGVSPQILRRDRWLRQGLRFVKIGRLVRYDRADVEVFVEKHRVEPTANGLGV
jgi:excisionase family DNA binding protein